MRMKMVWLMMRMMKMEVGVSHLPSDLVCHSLRCHAVERGKKKKEETKREKAHE